MICHGIMLLKPIVFFVLFEIYLKKNNFFLLLANAKTLIYTGNYEGLTNCDILNNFGAR